MAKDIIEIELRLKKAEQAIDALKKVKDGQEEIVKKQKSITQRFKDSWLKIAAGAGVAALAISKAFNITKAAAKFQQSMQAAEKQFGKSGDEIIKKLKEVSANTISNADLISAANKAMALNVTTDLDQMAKLMEVARIRGQAMGIDTTQAFEDIVTGIGRGSPLILDNLGIITKGWAEEAKAAGKAMDTQFILNKVLADGAEIIERAGGVTLTNAEKLQQFSAEVENLKLSIGDALIPIVVDLLKVLKPIVVGFSRLPKMVKAIGVGLTILIPAFIALNAAMGPIGIALAAVAGGALLITGALSDANDELERTNDTADEFIKKGQKLANIFSKGLAAGIAEEDKNKKKKLALTEDELKMIDRLKKAEMNKTENVIKNLEKIRNKLKKGSADRLLVEQEITDLTAAQQKLRTDVLQAEADRRRAIREQELADQIMAIDAVNTLTQSSFDLFIQLNQNKIDAILSQENEYQTALTEMDEADRARTQQTLSEEIAALRSTGDAEDAELADEKQRQIDRMKLEDNAVKRDKEIRVEAAKAQRKQAILQKSGALFSIAADTAKGIMSAMSMFWLSGGQPWASIIAATGALQAAAVVAQPLPEVPKFQQGGSFTVPPGFDNDNFPMLVSSGERVSVTPASHTETNDNRNITINAYPMDYISFVNDLKREQGLEVFQ